MPPLGAATCWWLHESLGALARDIAAQGGQLILRQGRAPAVLAALAQETEATAVYWNRGRDPWSCRMEEDVATALRARGVTCHIAPANSLFPAGDIVKPDGTAYKVFSAFRRAALAETPVPPSNERADPAFGKSPVPGDSLEDWNLCPAHDRRSGYAAVWQPGEAGALARQEHFVAEAIETYHRDRDRADIDGTSRLSPHLAWGELSAANLWHSLNRAESDGAAAFRDELLWREFTHHTLFARPEMLDTPLDPAFAAFPWQDHPEILARWQRGETGYPIVDAAMRALRRTGWMHNRLRMTVASFLVKDLGIAWQAGERWFRESLVDADMAANAFNWQWVAGCGYDAAPFFRIFNPVRQSEKADPSGRFIRDYVPELANLPHRHIHAPWQAPQDVLAKAKLSLGRDYPYPVIAHEDGRQRALAGFEKVKAKKRSGRQ